MNREQLVKVIDFWLKSAESGRLFPRVLTEKIDIKNKEVVDIVGPRRSGKSSVLKLLVRKVKDSGRWLYVNFEDPFFVENNYPQVIEEIVETYTEYFGVAPKFLFFDEIQSIKNWETAVRKLRDDERFKIFITGSSSKLLSSELSTLLSGRHLSYQLLPLSFSEYLSFHNVEVSGKKDMVLKSGILSKHFREYLKLGGFPEAVLSGNLELLKQYYNDIVQKDIVARYDVRDKDVLEKMGVFLFSNSAKTLSVSALSRLYDLSRQTAANYGEYFKDAFLLFDLSQFSYSLKTTQKAFKKIYAVDTGMANAVSMSFSEDRGRMLENTVFLHLKRVGGELYYYKEKSAEVDFVVKRADGSFSLIQVCWGLADAKTKEREAASLAVAMKELRVAEAMILTFDESGELELPEGKIQILPAYAFIHSLI
ncbi:MAG: ATP-binding protein [Candidatus Magasanikbacteria bacterium]|nr:ATP-binding protein [Candidatus Magasanikbacteria bacterium]